MNLTEAMRAIIALLKNCALPDADDFTQHAYYGTVDFRPEYPLDTLDVPVVALSPVGGLNRAKGLGKWERWHDPRLQLDVLAENMTYARRIYEKVCEVILFDFNDGAGLGDGTYGSIYLYGQGLKNVQISEARTALWDEEGRISRLVADVILAFSD